MKIAILCAVILVATTAAAETVIIEYPDHYYVESTGIPEGKPVTSKVSSAPPAAAHTVTVNQSEAPPGTARTFTNFQTATHPVDPAELRAEMAREIQRLQSEVNALSAPQEGETPDQASARQHQAAWRLRKINRMSSEMLKIPAQSIDLSQ
jgi:hypothetical protein